MKRFCYPFALLISLLTSLSFISLSFAQDLSVEEVVAKLSERAETVEDARFLLTGNLIDADAQELPLEVNVSSLPKEGVLRAEFLQPDALADNFIVIDGQDVYNYVYLTNQVTILDLSDPAAFGGLFPADEGESTSSSFTFTLDLVSLFDGWAASSQGLSESDTGNVYTLRFDNTEKGLAIDHVEITVSEATWLPTTMTFYGPDDVLIAEIVLNDFEVNTGLNPDDVRYVDPSAEVIDER
jgi:outer membrane lipoprotein-sorting protein